MGIRFLCTACHKKLNVKSFLAGRKGVCPKCGGSIQIPLESQLPSKKEAEQGAAAAAQGETALAAPAAGEQPMQAFGGVAGTAVAAPESPMPAPANGQAAQAPTPAFPSPAAQPQTSPSQPVQPQTDTVQPQAGPVDAGQPQVPMQAGPAIPSPQIPNPVAAQQHVPAGSTAAPAAAPGFSNPVVQPAPAPPSAPQLDPIREDPNLFWYVRPPSGGQFGPAKGDIMLKWIDEGRVSEDSLVWREGWADWKKASEAIPSMAPDSGPAASGAESEMVSAGRSSASATNAHRSRKRKNSQMALFSVIMLVFVSIALLVTLVIKLSGGG